MQELSKEKPAPKEKKDKKKIEKAPEAQKLAKQKKSQKETENQIAKPKAESTQKPQPKGAASKVNKETPQNATKPASQNQKQAPKAAPTQKPTQKVQQPNKQTNQQQLQKRAQSPKKTNPAQQPKKVAPAQPQQEKNAQQQTAPKQQAAKKQPKQQQATASKDTAKPELNKAPKVPVIKETKLNPNLPKDPNAAQKVPQKVDQRPKSPSKAQAKPTEKPATPTTKQQTKPTEKPTTPTTKQQAKPTEKPAQQHPQTKNSTPKQETGRPKSPKPAAKPEPTKQQSAENKPTSKPDKKPQPSQKQEQKPSQKQENPQKVPQQQNAPARKRSASPAAKKPASIAKEATPSAANRAKSPQPKRTKADASIIAQHRAMRIHDGHVTASFTDAVSGLLFKEGTTLNGTNGEWVQTNPDANEMNRTRSDLLHAILLVSSLHVFAPNNANNHPEISASLDNLPHASIIKSTCRIAFRYMSEKGDSTTVLLLKNALTLCIRLFTNVNFRQAFKSVSPQNLLRGLYISETNLPPLFTPLDPISKESLSFLYMCALFNPGFVEALTKKDHSNNFLFHLLWAAQLFFEKEGVNYIHSIILSTVLLIVADPEAAVKLNQPFNKDKNVMTGCNYKPADNISYGDLILNVLLNFCQRESFLPSLICVFHMISPHVNVFSLETASSLMVLFERVYDKHKSFLPLFLEVFATIVQQRDNKKNGFCPVIFSRAKLFKEITSDLPSVQKTLPIIRRYIKKARITIKNENKQNINVYEVSGILAKINTEQLFPNPQMFIKHPHIFGGEIEKTWDQWADLVFQKTCEPEVKNIKKLRLHLLNRKRANKGKNSTEK
ncbi:hypothetical protein TRFO_07706 [Tritrichomonas foetus]|uniref:Uncharacterized protein n=1 Tax=Tritrichomonas foetus TaxID=1144522 RepID=A0A1J4JPH2_9EUKA|nr:hypothetical protein TRFO_07706 [Tritrichomonas foetus]|eukprot:OHT01033.1 hypothetical protein TRFO_07706 [Tritrichomonas foetus]